MMKLRSQQGVKWSRRQGFRFVNGQSLFHCFVLLYGDDDIFLNCYHISLKYICDFQGKYKALFVCWILGMGSLVSWNSMLTIGDYYYHVFPVSFCIVNSRLFSNSNRTMILLLLTIYGLSIVAST